LHLISARTLDLLSGVQLRFYVLVEIEYPLHILSNDDYALWGYLLAMRDLPSQVDIDRVDAIVTKYCKGFPELVDVKDRYGFVANGAGTAN